MENTQGCNPCLYEHGLCLYVETKNHKLLIDTGQSNKTWENAKFHNIDLTSIDTIILSHGHYDHSGGILGLININPTVTIYMHKNAIYDYYSRSKGEYRYIGIDKEILNYKNIIYIDKDIKIDDEISIYTNVTDRKMWPKSNTYLSKKVNNQFIQDSFDHEIYIVLNEDNTTYLCSGCAHNGIINILDKYHTLYNTYPDYVLSGFHMKKTKEYKEDEIQLIKDIAYELKKLNTIFYTGHCTGEKAFNIMKPIVKEQLIYMHSGDIIK